GMSTAAVKMMAVVFMLTLLEGTASAHALSPALLDIEELADARIAVWWKISIVQPTGATLQPVLPADCAAEAAPEETANMDSITARWTARCPGGLVGRTVGVEGLATGKTDALVRVRLSDGRVVQGVVRGGE